MLYMDKKFNSIFNTKHINSTQTCLHRIMDKVKRILLFTLGEI